MSTAVDFVMRRVALGDGMRETVGVIGLFISP